MADFCSFVWYTHRSMCYNMYDVCHNMYDVMASAISLYLLLHRKHVYLHVDCYINFRFISLALSSPLSEFRLSCGIACGISSLTSPFLCSLWCCGLNRGALPGCAPCWLWHQMGHTEAHSDQWWARLENGLVSPVAFSFFSHRLEYHTDAVSTHPPAVTHHTHGWSLLPLSRLQELTSPSQ